MPRYEDLVRSRTVFSALITLQHSAKLHHRLSTAEQTCDVIFSII